MGLGGAGVASRASPGGGLVLLVGPGAMLPGRWRGDTVQGEAPGKARGCMTTGTPLPALFPNSCPPSCGRACRVEAACAAAPLASCGESVDGAMDRAGTEGMRSSARPLLCRAISTRCFWALKSFIGWAEGAGGLAGGLLDSGVCRRSCMVFSELPTSVCLLFL